ncbi:MAG: hypothetical protein ABI559_00765 [Chloroflexota bacterium]
MSPTKPKEAKEAKIRRGTHRIYVVDLDPNVWHKRATMRKANPRYMPITGKGYLYVGATSKTAEERFAIHKAGGLHSAPVVRIFGRYLRPRLYAGYKRMSRKDAEVMEPYVAERLRKKGYAVWPVKEGGLFTMQKGAPPRPTTGRSRQRRRAA